MVHAHANLLVCIRMQAAHGAGKGDVVWDDVGGMATMYLAYGQHSRMQRIHAPANNLMQGLNDLAGYQDYIDTFVRPGGMSATTKNLHIKQISGSTHCPFP